MKRLGPKGTLFAAAICAALNGCGSSGSPNTVTSTVPHTTAASTAARTPAQSEGLSHAALIARLNAICAAGNAKIEGMKTAKGVSTAQDLEALLRTAQSYLPQLEALHPTAQDQSAFQRYVQAFKRQLGFYSRLVVATRANDQAAMGTIEGSLNETSKARATAAIDLGAEKCGQI